MAAYNTQLLAQALRKPDIQYPVGGGTVGRPQGSLGQLNSDYQQPQQAKQPSLQDIQQMGDMMNKAKGMFGGSGSSGAIGSNMMGGSTGALSGLGSYGGYGGATTAAGASPFGLGAASSGMTYGAGAGGAAGASPFGLGAASSGMTYGGGAAGAGGAGAGGAGAGMAAFAWPAAILAAIGWNEEDSRKKGLRAEDHSERYQDMLTGKVLTQDIEGKWGPMMDKWTGGKMSGWGLTGDMKGASQIGSGRIGPGLKTLYKEGTTGKIVNALKKLF